MAGVPLYELILHPFCQRYSSFITSRSKFIVGMLILLLSQLNSLALDVAGHVTNNNNVTLSFFLKRQRMM